MWRASCEASASGTSQRSCSRTRSATTSAAPRPSCAGSRVDRVLDPRLAVSGPFERAALAEAAIGVCPSSRRARATAFGSAASGSACSGRTAPERRARTRTGIAIVLLASYGEVDALLTADAETDVTARLLSRHDRDPQGRAPRLGRPRARGRAARAAAGRRGHLLRPRQRVRPPDAVHARRAPRQPRAQPLPHRRGRPRRARVGRPADLGPFGALSRLASWPIRPRSKPVYLLTGSDRPKIETALARLRRHFEPEAMEIVSAQEQSGSGGRRPLQRRQPLRRRAARARRRRGRAAEHRGQARRTAGRQPM